MEKIWSTRDRGHWWQAGSWDVPSNHDCSDVIWCDERRISAIFLTNTQYTSENGALPGTTPEQELKRRGYYWDKDVLEEFLSNMIDEAEVKHWEGGRSIDSEKGERIPIHNTVRTDVCNSIGGCKTYSIRQSITYLIKWELAYWLILIFLRRELQHWDLTRNWSSHRSTTKRTKSPNGGCYEG